MVLTWNHSKRGGSSMSTVVCRETWIKFFGFLPLQRGLGHHVFLACFAIHWMSLGFPSRSEWISHFDQARHYMHGALRWLGAWLFCVTVDSLDAIRCHNILAPSSSLAWHGNMKVHWNYLSVFLPVKHSCFLFRNVNCQRVGTNPIVLFSCKVRRPLCPVSALCPLQAGTWFVGNGTNCRCGQLWPINGHGDQFRNKWDFADSLETSDLVNHFDPLPRDELANITSYFNLPCCRRKPNIPQFLGEHQKFKWGCLKIQNPQILSFIIILSCHFPNKITIFTGAIRVVLRSRSTPGLDPVATSTRRDIKSKGAEKTSFFHWMKKWVPTMLSK